MIDAIIEWFKVQANSQIFGGVAAGAMAATALGYLAFLARHLPLRLLALVERVFTIEIAVRSDDAMYGLIAHWLASQPFMDKSRRLRLVSGQMNSSRHPRPGYSSAAVPDDNDDGPRVPQWMLVPAAGTHWAWFKGRLLQIQVDDGTSDGPPGAGGQQSSKPLSYVIETIRITIIGRSREIVRDMILEAAAMIKAEEYRVRVYTSEGSYWNRSLRKMPRPLSSVVTSKGLGEMLRDDMRRFLDSREWYAQRGIPWRRGYSFDGPPGTGKSSLAIALASELKCGLYTIGLGSTLTDGDVAGLLSSVPERAIVLIEDIDTFAVSQNRVVAPISGKEEKGMLTLSGLLNALDGVAASEGRILIMTTNHPEHLDAALTRAGRVDVAAHLGNFTAAESVRMWRLFFGENHHLEGEFAANVGNNMQPAALQELLMRHANDPAGVVEALRVKAAA